MSEERKIKEKTMRSRRLTLGEAYMFCKECGAKLHSFDGTEDAYQACPYKKDGVCDPEK
jgi:hypothetical protein